MFLKKIFKRPLTVAFRLGIGYALMFLILSLGVFASVYLLMQARLQRQIDESLWEEVQEYDFLFETQGMTGIETELSQEDNREDTRAMFFRLLDSEGKELDTSDTTAWKDFDFQRIKPRETKGRRTLVETVSVPETTHGHIRVLTHWISPEIILQVGHSFRDVRKFLVVLRRTMGLTVMLSLILATAGGWLMARRSLAGVEKITQAARTISETSLEHRVPVTGSGDEIDRLAATFNNMLNRIQGLVQGMREINDNIAHDLRSPITRIRGLAETTIAGDDSVAQYHELAGATVEEADRLLAMINTMLDISEIEAGVAPKNLEEFDMAEMIHEGIEIFQPVAEERGIRLRVETSPFLRFRGDIRKIQRALSNLIDNAIKYTPEGGSVDISAGEDDNKLRITVSDTGSGIPETDRDRIFDRFFRGGENRDRTGSGLGLSLVQAVVRAHGGEISSNSFLGQGTTFIITLPLYPR